MVKIWRSTDDTEAPPPAVIQIGNQPLVGLLIDRLGANLIPRVTSRDDRKTRVDDFLKSDCALKTNSTVGGIHKLSQSMAEIGLSVRRWASALSATG